MQREVITLPPGPKTPAFWQLLHYSHSPLEFLESCARRYGDPFMMHLAGYRKLVILSEPDAVRDVFRGDPLVLHSGEGNEFLSITVGSSSVLVLDDQPHARQRRILLPPMKGERMRAFFGAIQQATLDAIARWPLNRPIQVLDPMRRITLRVILQAVLGLPPGEQLDGFERKVHRLLANGRSRYTLVLMKLATNPLVRRIRWVPYYRQLRDLDNALFDFIAARRREAAASRGDNILADLLSAVHDDGSPLSDQEIRDAVITMLMAGHETTSVALAWALEQIVPRQDVVDRIVDECRGAGGDSPPAADQLARLEYLDAAIRESLRVRTIFPFVVRLTKQPFVAGGREYPAGVLLCPCNHLVHRREDLYPEPRRFRPERFLERQYLAHEWFPFGGSNRMCLGMAFALYEMKVVMSTILTQVRLVRPPGSRSQPIRRGLALTPSDGARMIVTQRL